jgi:hypothetical protein
MAAPRSGIGCRHVLASGSRIIRLTGHWPPSASPVLVGLPRQEPCPLLGEVGELGPAERDALFALMQVVTPERFLSFDLGQTVSAGHG